MLVWGRSLLSLPRLCGSDVPTEALPRLGGRVERSCSTPSEIWLRRLALLLWLRRLLLLGRSEPRSPSCEAPPEMPLIRSAISLPDCRRKLRRWLFWRVVGRSEMVGVGGTVVSGGAGRCRIIGAGFSWTSRGDGTTGAGD